MQLPTLRKDRVPATSAPQNPVVAQISNTVSRPGALTTEWWSIVIAGAASAGLALTGIPGSEAAQVAGIIAPIVLALVYVFVRTRTKGALAEVLHAVFPQADGPGPGGSNPPAQGGSNPPAQSEAAPAADPALNGQPTAEVSAA
jgi:hypothetical protein